ncbi:hypothetical protein Tco_1171086 [Tanacetum coccineum]
MVVEGKVLNDFLRFVGVLIAEFATGSAVNLALKMKGGMIIKNLDLKPMIDAMMREFLEVLPVLPEFCSHSQLKRIEHGSGSRSSHVVMDPAGRRSSQLLA